MVLVVPCFNEAERLDPVRFAELARDASIRIVFVDDGSTDTTWSTISTAARRHAGIRGIRLGANVGKAEAVRIGLLSAIRSTPTPVLVGFADADLSTPEPELARLVAIARARPELSAVLGARVALLGHHVERSYLRHFAGRIFATVGSLVLGVAVYDTQCGAKVFKVTEDLRRALAIRFNSRWAFDVELLGRLLASAANSAAPPTMVEVPLNEWHHVGRSNLTPTAAVRSGIDLLAIAPRLARYRREHLR